MEYLYALSFRDGKSYATTGATGWIEACERAVERGFDLSKLARVERVPLPWASHYEIGGRDE